MEIRITYCGIWNYLPKAQVVSVELRNSPIFELLYISNNFTVKQENRSMNK